MDAHLFRRVCQELVPLLTGRRIKTIHAPAPDMHTLTLYAAGSRQVLVLRHGRRAPLLYLSAHTLPNPARPEARIMLLRKHLAGRRVVRAECDWPRRRLALRMAPGVGQQEGQGTLVLLDLREGMRIVDCLPHNFGEEPVWPRLPPPSQPGALKHALYALCDRNPGGAATGMDPVLTPALRRTLTTLVRGVHSAAASPGISPGMAPDVAEGGILDASALLADLGSGAGDVFLYRQPPLLGGAGACEPVRPDRPGEPDALLAWPLPAALRGDRVEEIHASALDAVAILGETAAFVGIADAARAGIAAPFRAEVKRLRRLLARLDDEEHRLRGLLEQREDAIALQAVLYRYAPDARLTEARVDGMGAGTAASGPAAARTLRLDPLRTVRENMAAMFHRSDRGARGLVILARRRTEVARQLAAAEQAVAAPPGTGLPSALAGAVRGQALPAKGAPNSRKPPRTAVNGSGVQCFRSSDGFSLLRGRCAEGNAQLLRIASPFDWWLHAEDGPSAHLIIRRDHPAHAVPEGTLTEAAALVAAKSWQRNAAHARIMVALVRDVRAVKGAAPGAVRVDAVLRSLTVAPDSGLESALRAPDGAKGDAGPCVGARGGKVRAPRH